MVGCTFCHLSPLSTALVGFIVSFSSASYSNITLTSQDGDLDVIVYLPAGVKPAEATYYVSSRFEHGSMIGSMRRKSHETVGSEFTMRIHELFGSKNWRVPHNSQWPESGVGLASEYGVGDDGAFCQYRCGWDGVNDVTNGVLGYREARNGEPFLKIGVGALIKGSCPSCDSTDNYRFNSPYEFAELPKWRVVHSSKQALAMEHEAAVKQYGYRLHKDVVLDGNVLSVTSILTNLGDKAFSTAWYSHNFFTCDGTPVQEGYRLDLDVRGKREKLYEEPGVIGSWAQPLETFARITEYPDHVSVDITRPVEGDTRIKAEFVKDSISKGGFTLHGCDTLVRSELPDVEQGKTPMYAYNLYLEKGTFSPEPQIMIHLEPGGSTSWTQRVVIEDEKTQRRPIRGYIRFGTISLKGLSVTCSRELLGVIVAVSVLTIVLLLGFTRLTRSNRRSRYRQIPDTCVPQA